VAVGTGTLVGSGTLTGSVSLAVFSTSGSGVATGTGADVGAGVGAGSALSAVGAGTILSVVAGDEVDPSPEEQPTTTSSNSDALKPKSTDLRDGVGSKPFNTAIHFTM
jgi:hypothetical protein